MIDRLYRFELRGDDWSAPWPSRCRAWDPAYEREVILTRFNVADEKLVPPHRLEAAIGRANHINPDVEVFSSDGFLYVAAPDELSAEPVLASLQANGVSLGPPQPKAPPAFPPPPVAAPTPVFTRPAQPSPLPAPAPAPPPPRPAATPRTADTSRKGRTTLLKVVGVSALAGVLLVLAFLRSNRSAQNTDTVNHSQFGGNAPPPVQPPAKHASRPPPDRLHLPRGDAPSEPPVERPTPAKSTDKPAARGEFHPPGLIDTSPGNRAPSKAPQQMTAQNTPPPKDPETSASQEFSLHPSASAQQPPPRPAVDEPHYSSGPSVSGQASPVPAEPAAPAPEPKPAVPHTALPRPDEGPKEGTLVWSGEVKKNQQIRISGSSVSLGSLSGNLFPGRPIQITLNSRGFAVVTTPNPLNQFSELVLQSAMNGRIALTIHWTVLP